MLINSKCFTNLLHFVIAVRQYFQNSAVYGKNHLTLVLEAQTDNLYFKISDTTL